MRSFPGTLQPSHSLTLSPSHVPTTPLTQGAHSMPRTHNRFLQLHRRRQVAKLTLQGFTQVDIAERLKTAQSTISRDLRMPPFLPG